eukprot:4588781-Amphidinium_carterae.1
MLPASLCGVTPELELRDKLNAQGRKPHCCNNSNTRCTNWKSVFTAMPLPLAHAAPMPRALAPRLLAAFAIG